MRDFIPQPGDRVRIVRAYDERIVGMELTVRYAGRSHAESVRRDGYILVQAPELDALELPDSVSYSMGGYCEVEAAS